ncbi:MAG TPA: hypothetical protein VIU61_23590 [Kofleriaceae bacterium]
MRLALVTLVSLVGSAGSAGAQPVTAPAACDVKIVRAPDDVRAVIESWVKAEPRCAVRLEVRVVPTQGGGLYLLVRDEHGRERERVVPDAQSAGVLVASWAADDSIIPDAPAGPAPAPAFGPELPPAPVQAPAAPPVAEAAPPAAAPVRVAAAPGLTPASAPVGITATAAPRPPSKRWLTIGAMGRMGEGDVQPFGVRAELDLRTRGNWVFAVGASLQNAEVGLYDGSGYGMIDTTDLRAVASIAWTKHRGRWQLRLGVGAGLMFTTAEGDFDGDLIQADGVSPTLELSALVARELTARWALTAGLILTATHQEYVIPSSSSMLVLTRDGETHGFAGLRRRF